MPGKPHHQVLVFKKTVWLSVHFDTEHDTQKWLVYKRPKGQVRNGAIGQWWLGLTPKGHIPGNLKNAHVPEPLLTAYAFTEWSLGDTPQRPDGTDLWVEHNPPNHFEIWYSPLNWDRVLVTEEHDWTRVGFALWEP